jgi:hypothetical protein
VIYEGRALRPRPLLRMMADAFGLLIVFALLFTVLYVLPLLYLIPEVSK